MPRWIYGLILLAVLTPCLLGSCLLAPWAFIEIGRTAKDRLPNTQAAPR